MLPIIAASMLLVQPPLLHVERAIPLPSPPPLEPAVAALSLPLLVLVLVLVVDLAEVLLAGRKASEALMT